MLGCVILCPLLMRLANYGMDLGNHQKQTHTLRRYGSGRNGGTVFDGGALNQSLLGRRLEHVVHLQPWVAVLLRARAVGTTRRSLVACHHQERANQGTGYRKNTDHDGHHDQGDVGTGRFLRL